MAAQVYPPLVGLSAAGLALPFAIGAVAMVAQYFVVKHFFVETKGVPLERLGAQLLTRRRAPAVD